ncbi:MAG TPA: hypothetical protein VH183_00540 [Burkholderiaceae bacterium]|jgi:hypothetical protein|nr:hypothetical protein [Burkholderiaceae bacterium]
MHSLKVVRPLVPTYLIVACLIGWSAVAPAAPADEPHPATADADRAQSTPAELTAVARLLAGVDPQSDNPGLQAVARSDAWKTHRKASRYGDRQLQERLQRMDRWQRAALPSAPPGGALIYPFSGPDFVNAFALFPDYKTYVFFSLEPPGEVPALARMDEHQLGELFSDLRGALNDLVALNFFITPNMKENLQTDNLQGTVPLLLAQMGLLGLTVESVEPFDPWPATAQAGARRTGKPSLPLRAVRIEFDDRAKTRRTLLYLSLDVSDSQLRYYPEFAPWLRSFEQPTVLLKSASYLLHGGNFRQVRGAVRERARLIVQDDTGMPYRILRDDGFRISLYGQYERPVKLFENRYQKDLDDAFASAGNTDPVPFPFGYNWRKEGRSGVIVARRPGSDT